MKNFNSLPLINLKDIHLFFSTKAVPDVDHWE